MRMRCWALGALLFLSIAPPAQASIVAYMSDDDMFKVADIVMVASVWRWSPLKSTPYDFTEYELEALECFKGCQVGQFILMATPGGHPNDTSPGLHELIEGAPSAEPGDQVIVYLKKMPTGELQLVSFGLSHYKLSYNATTHRFFARRSIDGVAVMRPTLGPGRRSLPEDAYVVSRDVLAGDLLDALRALGKK